VAGNPKRWVAGNPKRWVAGDPNGGCLATSNGGCLATSAAGTYTVVASFAGSADYSAARSGPVTFTIGAGTAAIALTSSAGSTDYGQSIAFVADLAASVAPGGTVTFLDGGTTLATVPLDGSGAATLLTNGSTPSLTLRVSVPSGRVRYKKRQRGSASADRTGEFHRPGAYSAHTGHTWHPQKHAQYVPSMGNMEVCSARREGHLSRHNKRDPGSNRCRIPLQFGVSRVQLLGHRLLH
jgi:hypothetical protein